MSGTSRETVSRALKLLEKEGFVQRNGRELIIHDYNQFVEEFDS
jgi:CRP-like cAMP-binding protein